MTEKVVAKELIADGAKVLTLNTQRIKRGWRARQDDGDLKALAESIRSEGQMHPVLVRRSKEKGQYIIIAGMRRTQACKMLDIGVKAIVVKPADELAVLDLQLAENIFRKNFDSLEIGEGLKRRKAIYERKHPDTKHGTAGKGHGKDRVVKNTTLIVERFTLATAKQMGVSESKIQKLLKAADLPEEEKEKIEKAPTTRERNRLVQDAERTRRKQEKEERLAKAAEERQAQRRKQSKKKSTTKQAAEKEEQEIVGSLMPGTWESQLDSIRETKFDLILTDPPYNLKRSLVSHTTRGDIGERIEWDHLDVGWVVQLAPLLESTGQILAFCPLEAIGEYRAAFEQAKMKYRGAIIWHRSNPGTAHRSVYLSSCEAIVWATVSDKYHFEPWDNAGAADVHNFRDGAICCGNDRLDHPTQKPLWLVADFLLRHTAAGDNVLDPFAGVCTTLVAAKLHGRHSVGIECNKQYVRLAKLRLQAL